MTRDRGVGIFFMILGAVVAVMTTQIPQSQMANDIGPRVFPYISAFILFVCGAVLAFRKNGPANRPFLSNKTEVKRFLAIIAVIIGYVVGMWALGYVIPTAAMVSGMCLMFGKGKKVPVWLAIVYGVAVTLIIYAIFTYGLHLRLPKANLF